MTTLLCKKVKRCAAAFAAILCLLTGCGGGGTASPHDSETADVSVDSTLNVWCFQAGKADAFLLWNEAGSVLIDTGESGFGKTILEKLTELGIERLDYLILTHFDKDHVGGAKKILSGIQLGTVLQSNSPKEGAEAYEKYLAAVESCGVAPVTLRQDLSFRLDDTEFLVNPPARELYERDESNNSSLIVTVTHGKTRLLFCGDAEDLRLSEFLETDSGSFDVVKLPHHGRYQSTLKTLLELTRPSCAVITSSDEEPEDAETMELLSQRGVNVLLTRSGPICLRITGEGWTAE